MLTFLKSLLQSLFIVLSRPAAPTLVATAKTPTQSDRVATLAQLIESRTLSIGPMPRTGGTIHAVTKAEAPVIAAIIVKSAAARGLRLSLVQALLDGESRDDAGAIDPNDQLAKPGESASDAFEHTDYGIEQEDGSTTDGDPAFAKMTTAQKIAKLLDPQYGVDFVCFTLQTNLAAAAAAFKAEPTLASQVPDGNPEVLACEAYNTGFHGALTIARTNGVKGNWSYGAGVVAKAAGWAAVLGG